MANQEAKISDFGLVALIRRKRRTVAVAAPAAVPPLLSTPLRLRKVMSEGFLNRLGSDDGDSAIAGGGDVAKSGLRSGSSKVDDSACGRPPPASAGMPGAVAPPSPTPPPAPAPPPSRMEGSVREGKMMALLAGVPEGCIAPAPPLPGPLKPVPSVNTQAPTQLHRHSSSSMPQSSTSAMPALDPPHSSGSLIKMTGLLTRVSGLVSSSMMGMSRRKGSMQGSAGGDKHELSGKTGSLMYMAPEVYRQEQYNEKAGRRAWGGGGGGEAGGRQGEVGGRR